MPLRSCEHIFHKECLEDYIKSQIADLKLHISCPEASCGTQLAQVDIKACITKDHFERFEKLMLDEAVGNLSDIFWCPTADCKYAFDPNGQNELRCPFCKIHYCLLCRNKWHKPDFTCE